MNMNISSSPDYLAKFPPLVGLVGRVGLVALVALVALMDLVDLAHPCQIHCSFVQNTPSLSGLV